MKIRKMVTFAMAAVMCAGTIAGCGSSKDGASKDGASDKGGSSEILLWSSATGPDGERIQKTINAYNETSPDYKVKFVSMQADTLNTKLTTAGRSGKGVPDLALVASEALPTYHTQEMLESWDDMIADSELKKENYVESAWEVGNLEGGQYGIPATMGSWVMFYNKDLMEKYAPNALDDGYVTYEEIEAAGEAAKADGIFSYANTWSMQNYSNLYLQMGGEWLDADGKISINNEASVGVVEELKKLNDLGYMVPNGEDANKMFMNGKLIFLPEGTWMLSNMEAIKDFAWGETFTPQWDATKVVQCSGVDQFAVFKSGEERSDEKKQGMVRFLEWLQGNQLEWVKSGANPSSLAMLENEEYLVMPQSFLLTTEEGRAAININAAEGLTYVFNEYDARAWDMITGKADIAQTFEEIQKIVDEKMK